jgi:hypothetical protein
VDRLLDLTVEAGRVFKNQTSALSERLDYGVYTIKGIFLQAEGSSANRSRTGVRCMASLEFCRNIYNPERVGTR